MDVVVMKTKFSGMEKREVSVQFDKTQGALCYRNHSFGIGGINSLPIPARVVDGVKKLKPKMIRIFLQEFFFIYPDHYVFDWTKMDAYIKAVHETGADIMAHITIKPKPLYPIIDENIWMPTDVEEWQDIIEAMVKRYSVENKYVTHWAIANEINIGEWGGCPYRFDSPVDYFEYYKMTATAIAKASPNVKIGGPAWAGAGDDVEEYFEKFFELVKEEGLPLDFISYNAYYDSPEEHLDAAKKFRGIVDKYDSKLGLYTTELNVRLVSDVEETAYMGARAASLAATIMSFTNENILTGTFQYHIVDQHCDIDDFKQFFEKYRYMSEHWNDYPHRLGLFDWDGKPRPQYFMYDLLYKMSGERLYVSTDDTDNLHIAASKTTDDAINVLICNFNPTKPTDLTTKIQLKGNPEGLYKLKTYRVDDEKRWDDNLQLCPIESRTIYMGEDFKFYVYTPAYSVVLVQLTST